MKILINTSMESIAYKGWLQAELSKRGFKDALYTSSRASLHHLQQCAHAEGCSAILLMQEASLKASLGEDASIEDYQGSLLHGPIPTYVLPPLHQIWSTKTGKARVIAYLDKLLDRHLPPEPFRYSIISTKQEVAKAEQELLQATTLVIDIETTTDGTNEIICLAITPIMKDSTIGHTYVYDAEGRPPYIHESIKRICASDIPKCFHNGVFDCWYLLRYSIPVRNYLFDTEYMWWCWHAEHKKSLAYISGMLLHDHLYWKDEASTNLLEYNAKDTIRTARCLIALLRKMPHWAWRNYSKLLPVVIPIISMNFEGLDIDVEQHAKEKAKAESIRDEQLQALQDMAGYPINPNSPKQLAVLLYDIWGAQLPPRTKARSTDVKTLKKLARQSPFLFRIITALLSYRKVAKAIGTYYEAHLLEDKYFYSLQPDGTETGRLASSKCPLYVPGKKKRNYGSQIQNTPAYFKTCIKAPYPDWSLMEKDKSQSEARCVAYISGDIKLKEALEAKEDFYCICAYLFFGQRITKEDPLRQLTKKIIHGTNYKMGAWTFIESVGWPEMYDAMTLLNYEGGVISFAKYLLSLYHKAYPKVSQYWDAVKQQIMTQGFLVTPDGWRREFLGDIVKDHGVWTAAIAHSPQHLSVAGLNRSIWRIFYEVQIPSGGLIRMKAQVHDSILFAGPTTLLQQKEAHITEIMEEPQQTPNGLMVIPIDTNISYHWKEPKEG